MTIFTYDLFDDDDEDYKNHNIKKCQRKEKIQNKFY